MVQEALEDIWNRSTRGQEVNCLRRDDGRNSWLCLHEALGVRTSTQLGSGRRRPGGWRSPGRPQLVVGEEVVQLGRAQQGVLLQQAAPRRLAEPRQMQSNMKHGLILCHAGKEVVV